MRRDALCDMACDMARDHDLFNEYMRQRETALPQFCARRLDELRPACDAGNALAIAEAITVCADCNVPPPSWLADAVYGLADRDMDHAERRNRRDLSLHYARWNAVREVAKLRAPLSIERCCMDVAEALAGSPIAGKQDAIAASYYLIEECGGERTTLESYQRAQRRRQEAQRPRRRASRHT